jgi:regulator of protease activity HflC (stomatin/prohibitin superfamily)
MEITLIIIGIVFFVIILPGFITVKQGSVAVITVFGKYRRIMGLG